MLRQRREQCLREIEWSTILNGPNLLQSQEHILAAEFWRRDGVEEAVEGHDWRWQWLSQDAQSAADDFSNTTERLARWLKDSSSDQRCDGGIRLILCDRPNMYAGMSMGEAAFKEVEASFRLHPATLPAFMSRGGISSWFLGRTKHGDPPSHVHVVVKACQKVEIGNFLLSLTYDIAARRTDAFVCGDGIVRARPFDRSYGEQLQQLITTIVAAPTLWTNPLLVPSALLQMYAHRAHLRILDSEEDLKIVETTLGVMEAGEIQLNHARHDWPHDIDPKETTVKLHSVLPQLIFLGSVCQWQRQYTDFITLLAQELRQVQGLEYVQDDYSEILETVRYVSSWIEEMEKGLTTFKERAQLQVNVLFNVISQQANFLSQRETRLSSSIAASAKGDSISMTTFTFITALFLPGTFIAGLFGSSMFDWLSEATINSRHTVSRRFWVYWAITIPLTLMTLLGWFVWFRYAKGLFEQEIRKANLDTNGVKPTFTKE